MLERLVRSPFVGRARELAEADAVFGRVRDGEGHTLLVSGEPGIGKTRLVREFTARATRAGARVFVCDCHAEGGAPYAPFAQFIRQALEPSSEELRLPAFALADLVTLAPALRARYPAIAPNPTLDPLSERERIFESAAELCAALAARAPVVLAIEDVHWADRGTLDLLRHVARRAFQMRLLLVLTYREEELHDSAALGRLLLDLNRERLSTHLGMSRFTLEQTRELLAELFGGGVEPAFLDYLYRQTEGNPFFIEEVVKGLLEDGTLYRVAERWHWPSPEQSHIPQNVRAVIRARVEKLPPGVQDVLRLAAIIGREFDVDLLRMAGGLEADQLIDALETAGRAGLIREMRRGGHSMSVFAHALIPSALQEDIVAPRRQHLHRQVAMAIEGLYPDDDEALAYHFSAAGERDKAIDYALKAAQRAQSVHAYDAAAQHLHRALDWLQDSRKPDTQAAIIEQLADIYVQQGDTLLAVPLFAQAIALWDALAGNDKMVAVRLRRKFGSAVLDLRAGADFQRFRGDARAQLAAARDIASGEPPHVETVYLLATLSSAMWIRQASADWEAAERYARAGVDMAEKLGDPVVMSVALDALALVYGAQGMLREQIELVQRRLALSDDARFRDQRERVRILMQLGAALASVGEYTDALRYLDEAQTQAGQIRALDLCFHTLASQAFSWLRLDRWNDVLRCEQVMVALQRRSTQDLVQYPCWHIAIFASAYALRGDSERARRLRLESAQIMGAVVGPDGWGRTQHY